MKFDELSSIWNSADLELEKTVTINKKLVMKVSLNKIKSRLFEIKWKGVIALPIHALFVFFLVDFIAAYSSDIRFYIPALILLTITIFSLVFEIHRLTLYYSLDSKSAVIEAQKILAQLKKLEILDIYSLFIIIPLFSAPFLIVVSKAFLNLSLYATSSTWLIYQTVGSVAIAVLIIFILRKYPNKELAESIAFLNELKENEG